jgi:hypothetical protein
VAVAGRYVADDGLYVAGNWAGWEKTVVAKGMATMASVGDFRRTAKTGHGDGRHLPLMASNNSVGAKAKTPPFALGLRRGRWFNGDKTTGRDTLRSIRHRTKTYDEVIPPYGLVQHGGPRVIRPIVTGPTWPLRVTGLICKGASVITVCNPALWEYSEDNLGV